jgi:hypothetical protein
MLSYVQNCGNLLGHKVHNPDGGDHRTREKGKDEFYDFVRKTYRGLYHLESRSLAAKTSISLFCWLDIGLIVVDGKVNYFINEVERTQTASLWSNSAQKFRSHTHINLLADTFGFALHAWLSMLTETTM